MQQNDTEHTIRPLPETGTILIVAAAADGALRFTSHVAARFFGLSGKHIHEINMTALFHTSSHGAELLEDVRAHTHAFAPHVLVRRADGTMQAVDIHAYQITQDDTCTTPFLFLFSESVRTGQDSVNSTCWVDEYQQAARSARIGIAEWDITTNDVFLDPVLRELLGYDQTGADFELSVLTDLIRQDVREKTLQDTQAFLRGADFEFSLITPLVFADGAERWFRMDAVVVRNVKNRPVRLFAVVTDVTDVENNARQIETRLRYEQGIAALSNLLVSTEYGERVVDDCLEILLNTTDVSRVYIFENFSDPADGLCMRHTHEVCADDVTPEIDNPILQHLPYREGYMRWHAILSKGNPVYGLVSEFPEAERSVLESQDIKSLLVIPIFVQHEWAGFVGFDHTVHTRQWTQEDILILRTAAELIGIYLGRVRQQEQLRMSEEFFRGAFTFSAIGMAVIDLDGVLLDLNASFSDMLGYDMSKIRRKSLSGVLQSADHEILNTAFSELIAGNRERARFEIQAHHENGTVIWLDTSLALMLEHDTTPKYFLAQFQDISERRRAEAALRESEKRYKLLFQNSYTINIISDPMTGRIIDGNAAACEYFEVSQDTLRSLYLGDQQLLNNNRITALIMDALKQGSMFEYKYKRLNGSAVTLEMYPTPVTLAQNEMVFLMIRDITERKRLEEQLIIRQKMDSLGDLAGGMAHDFNNLLTGIMGNLDLLRFDSNNLSGSQHEYVEEAYDGCRKSSELLNKIQLLSKSTFYKKSIEDVSVIAAEVMGVLEQITDPQIQKRTDIRSNTYTVCINPDHLRQIFMNLSTNAIRAIENKGVSEGDWLRISARKYTAAAKNPRQFSPGEYVHLMVKDTGEGMTDDVKLRAFDPLFTTKRRGTQKGQGLGLAVVYNIVTRHYGGYIYLSSQAGKGTTVHIYLPFAPVPSECTNQAGSFSGIGSTTR